MDELETAQTTPIRIENEKGDVLTHHMKVVKLPDFRAYNRELQKALSLKKGRVKGDTLKIELDFWRRWCLRVEGYTKDGEDVMEREDWKELIVNHRPLHCRTVMNLLLDAGEAAGDVDDDDDENDDGPDSDLGPFGEKSARDSGS